MLLSLPTFFYSDYINKRQWNNHYMQATIPNLSSRDVVFIPTNTNENHWLLLLFPALAKIVISIDSLNYENSSVLGFSFLKKHTSVYIK